MKVDEQWYLAAYPDVAASVGHGTFPNCQKHFEVSGFKEGRLASATWSL